MPELPEVETVVAALRTSLLGRVMTGAQFIGKVRLPFDETAVSKLVRNRRIVDVRRRAKYIVFDLDNGQALLAHLGMTGYFHLEATRTPLNPHDRLVFPLRGGEELRYADARRFGFVVPADYGPDGWPEQLDGLGVEPLSRAFMAAAMAARAAGRTCPVKNFIMDQAVVVGVGNIYASEALFAAGVDPARGAGSLSLEEWRRLVKETKAVLRRAIRKGGTTIINYRTVDGSEGAFQRRLMVYGRGDEACPKCGEPIKVVRLGGRSSFYCSTCQA